MIGKILGAAAAGGTMATTFALLHRFLSSAATIVILAIMSAFILCALVTGAFVLAFFALTHYGVDPFAAAIALGLAACMLACILVASALLQIRHLRELPFRSLPSTAAGGMLDINHIVDAFIAGFLHPRP